MTPPRKERNEKGQEPFQQILSRLAHIEHKVDSIDETNAFALRAQEDEHWKTIAKIFKRSRRRAQIYLAANGSRGVEEIAHHLGMKPPNVSPELKILKEEGLLELADTKGRKDVWAKKSIDKSLRISKQLCQEYGLDPEGRPSTKLKKKH